MAEVTGLRNNALPYPVYGVPWGVVYPLLDADGDLVTGATTPDAERSLNGDTFADCTNESTEIATNSGMYYLLLTAAEMTADVVAIIAKSATAGMKTTPIVLYPAKLPTLHSGTVGANAADGTTLQLASGASPIIDFYVGCLLVGTLDSNVEARVIMDYDGATKVCTVSPAFVTTPDNNDTYVVYQPWGRQYADANVIGISNAAVSTTTAQLGVNAVQLGATAQTGRDIGASVLLSAGTGTGQLDFTSGVAKANLAQILGTALTETAGQIAAAFKKWFDVAAPVGTVNSIPNATAGAAGGLFIAGTNAATTITGSLSTTYTGNASGLTVGAVSGAVGSVTGNVGGNVTGSVGSIATNGIAVASFAVETGFRSLSSATVPTTQSGSTSTTVVLSTTENATTGVFVGSTLVLTFGAGSLQSRIITAYNGTTKTATVSPPLQSTPPSGVTYAILPWGTVDVASWLGTAPSALISGRVDANTQATAAALTFNLTGNVTGNLSGSVGSVTGAVGSVTGNVGGNVTGSVGSIATGGIVSASFAAGAINAAAIGADAITDAKVASDVTIASVTGAVGSVTGNVGGNVVGSVASVTAGVTLAASAVQAIWNALTSALTTVGSIGKLLVDNVNATISSRLASASYTTPPTAAAISDVVWEEPITDHTGVSGSTAAALNAAGAAGDPWSTPLPGAYGAGTAGNIVGNNIDATISSRLATAGYTAPLSAAGTRTAVGLASANLDTQLGAIAGFVDTEVAAILAAVDTEVAAIKAKTDLIPAAPAATGDIPTVNQNADALLDRMNGIETGLTPRQSLRLISASVAGKLAGAATSTNTIRNAVADSKPRIIATVDADGNRTAITYDVS